MLPFLHRTGLALITALKTDSQIAENLDAHLNYGMWFLILNRHNLTSGQVGPEYARVEQDSAQSSKIRTGLKKELFSSTSSNFCSAIASTFPGAASCALAID